MTLLSGWWDVLLRPNWQLKLFALILAIFTYSAIRGATGYEVEYSIPVEVKVEPGIAVRAKNPEFVDVRFRGSQDDLLKLDQKNLKAVVSVHDDSLDGGSRVVPIRARDIEGKRGSSVVQVVPPSVVVTLDHEVETTFAVARPATIGTPLLGRVEIQYSPQTVIIRGPKQRIAELKAEGHDLVTPDPVDVDGRVESFSRRVKVQPPGGDWASRIDPAEITVQVNIVKKSVTRAWRGLQVRVVRDGTASTPVTIAPAVVDVSLEGRSEILESVTEKDLRIFVDCVGLDSALEHEVPVQVHLPTYMDVNVTVVPRMVHVAFPAL